MSGILEKNGLVVVGENCSKWFHKYCLSDYVMNMDEKELEDYELLCSECDAKEKSMDKKRQGS